MQNEINSSYEAPKVEVLEVEVEQGFVASASVNPWNNGGSLGNYETEY